MRNLLGEAAASILDNHVKTMVDGPSMQDVLQQLFALAGSTNMMLPDVSFGGLSASEYANLQADLIITS
jgi:REP element-mobilizing transposase RayT